MKKETTERIISPYIHTTIMNRPRLIVISLVLLIVVIASTFALEMKGVIKETAITAWMVPECIIALTPSLSRQWDGKTFLVDADIDDYKQSSAREYIYRGIVKHEGVDDQHPYNFRLTFNGKDPSIGQTDTYDELFRSFLGREVEIRGKIVQQATVRGILVGYIIPIGSVCPSAAPSLTPAQAMVKDLVYADSDEYKVNPAQECVYHGVLRDTRDISEGFFLTLDDGRGLDVSGGDNADEILATLDERQVEIRGKYVQKADGKRELWVGYITSRDGDLRSDNIFTSPSRGGHAGQAPVR